MMTAINPDQGVSPVSPVASSDSLHLHASVALSFLDASLRAWLVSQLRQQRYTWPLRRGVW